MPGFVWGVLVSHKAGFLTDCCLKKRQTGVGWVRRWDERMDALSGGGGVGEGVIWHNLFDRPIFHSFGFTACILYLLFFGMR